MAVDYFYVIYRFFLETAYVLLHCYNIVYRLNFYEYVIQWTQYSNVSKLKIGISNCKQINIELDSKIHNDLVANNHSYLYKNIA